MANVLPRETRNSVIHALCEGNSIRAVERLTGVAKSTILRLALAVGEGCERLHNLTVRGVVSPDIEADEQWSFVQKKAARVKETDPKERGDAWTFVGFCRRSRLVISYHVGKRDQFNTDVFIADLRSRLLVIPQLSTDGFAAYPAAVGASFMGSVDYGQVVKRYGYNRSPDYRYEPARDSHFIKKTTVFGAPEVAAMGTSKVERFNLTTRHTVGRTRRLCLAFSKTLRGHKAAIALGFAAYNFVRIHGSLRVTPAMEAGLTDHVWEIEELVDRALAALPAAKPTAHVLTPREGTGPVRELPNGKGFLRLVKSETAPQKTVPTTTPEPSPSPVTPVAVESPREIESPKLQEVPAQLDLFAWKPSTRDSVQLGLFGDDDQR